MKFKYNLGIALIPSLEDIDNLYSLVNDISTTFPLSFTTTGLNIPHVTLFAGKYKTPFPVIDAVEDYTTSKIKKTQDIEGMGIWAEKIIFLNLKKEALRDVHRYFFQTASPFSKKKPTDSQNFNGITSGQQRSLNKTGYPFSLYEYLPHFTLAHFKEIPENKKEIESDLNEILRDHNMKQVKFENLVIFNMSPLGACQEVIWNKIL